MELVTYLGDAKLKVYFLAEITKHEEQDALIKGTYAKMNGSFKGCAIGCSLHSLNVLQGKTGKASAQRAARDAWAAWAARDRIYTGAKAAAFSTALARFVIEELRALAPAAVA